MTTATIDCRRCGRRVTSEAPRCPECGAEPRSGESSFGNRGVDRARVCQGVGIRLAAFAIDTALLLLVFTLASYVVYLFMSAAGEFAIVGEEPSSWPFWVVFVVAYFVYFWLGEGLWGRTLGKRFCDLRVVATDGSAIGLGSAFVRTLLRIVDVLPAFYALGAVVIWSTRRRQRIGDLAAGTVVVRPRMLELAKLNDPRQRVVPWRAGAGAPAAPASAPGDRPMDP